METGRNLNYFRLINHIKIDLTEEDTREKGKLYKPQSKISELVDNRSSAEQAQEYARLLGSNERKLDRLGKKKKEGEKKKSNLELFKEELKMIQEEREERHKYKGVVKTVISAQSEDPMMAALKCVEGNLTRVLTMSFDQKFTYLSHKSVLKSNFLELQSINLFFHNKFRFAFKVII